MGKEECGEVLELKRVITGEELVSLVKKAVSDRNMLSWKFVVDVIRDDIVRIGRSSQYAYNGYAVLVPGEGGVFEEEICLKKIYRYICLRHHVYPCGTKIVEISKAAIPQSLSIALLDIKMAA
jgi:hypothetical protein